MEYFDNKWHTIKDEWVEGLKGFNLRTSTINRVERFNRFIKSVLRPKSAINTFFKDLGIGINSDRLEKNHKELELVQKV